MYIHTSMQICIQTSSFRTPVLMTLVKFSVCAGRSLQVVVALVEIKVIVGQLTVYHHTNGLQNRLPKVNGIEFDIMFVFVILILFACNHRLTSLFILSYFFSIASASFDPNAITLNLCMKHRD